jgi:hypothetical protein
MAIKFTYPNTIFVWSKNKNIITLAKRVAKDLKIELFLAEVEEDFYAAPFFFGIVDCDYLTPQVLRNAIELFEDEVSKKCFAIMVYPSSPIKIPVKIKRFFLSSPSSLDYTNLKLAVLSKKFLLDRQTKSNRSYLGRMERSFYIMRKVIEPGGYVRLEDLCAEFGVSAKTIKRDLDLFKLAGEVIKFDKKRKVYFLDYSYND